VFPEAIFELLAALLSDVGDSQKLGKRR